MSSLGEFSVYVTCAGCDKALEGFASQLPRALLMLDAMKVMLREHVESECKVTPEMEDLDVILKKTGVKP
ncbi:MAG: hypothetical protein V3V96_15550 [Acidiferrobacterales bacterium]